MINVACLEIPAWQGRNLGAYITLHFFFPLAVDLKGAEMREAGGQEVCTASSAPTSASASRRKDSASRGVRPSPALHHPTPTLPHVKDSFHLPAQCLQIALSKDGPLETDLRAENKLQWSTLASGHYRDLTTRRKFWYVGDLWRWRQGEGRPDSCRPLSQALRQRETLGI